MRIDVVVDRLLMLMAELNDRGESRLPAERALALQLGVARGTLRKALEWLQSEGVVERRVGRNGGTLVRQEHPVMLLEGLDPHAPFKVHRQLHRIQGIPALLNEQGILSTTRVLRTEERGANSTETARLGLPPGARVLVILRLRLANSEPLSLEQMTLPAGRFPNLLDRSLNSLYELFERDYGVTLAAVDETINISRASASVAQLLKVTIGTPLFDIDRISRDGSGVPVELSHDLFNATVTTLTHTANRYADGTGLNDDGEHHVSAQFH
ncbi:GntR family transcriptional regulator [Arthrobacter agilis]|uniref:GntR family transcriptional regulator n=1 Tax=Arthrobacter agilis TaxID=37921 RepID=UPI0027D84CF9|nr:GntR family transcriptional regulator [Arthrobacter agilis]